MVSNADASFDADDITSYSIFTEDGLPLCPWPEISPELSMSPASDRIAQANTFSSLLRNKFSEIKNTFEEVKSGNMTALKEAAPYIFLAVTGVIVGLIFVGKCCCGCCRKGKHQKEQQEQSGVAEATGKNKTATDQTNTTKRDGEGESTSGTSSSEEDNTEAEGEEERVDPRNQTRQPPLVQQVAVATKENKKDKEGAGDATQSPRTPTQKKGTGGGASGDAFDKTPPRSNNRGRSSNTNSKGGNGGGTPKPTAAASTSTSTPSPKKQQQPTPLTAIKLTPQQRVQVLPQGDVPKFSLKQQSNTTASSTTATTETAATVTGDGDQEN